MKNAIDAGIDRLVLQMRDFVDASVLDEVVQKFEGDDLEILTRLKKLLKPYKRELRGLKGRKGISYQTYTEIFDPTYNVKWPVLVKIKIGSDEPFDMIQLLGDTMERIAKTFGRRFIKRHGAEYSELVIR